MSHFVSQEIARQNARCSNGVGLALVRRFSDNTKYKVYTGGNRWDSKDDDGIQCTAVSKPNHLSIHSKVSPVKMCSELRNRYDSEMANLRQHEQVNNQR